MKKARRTFTLDAELDNWFNLHREINASEICEKALIAARGKEEKQEVDLKTLPLDDALKVELERGIKKRDWFRVQKIRSLIEMRSKKESSPEPPKEKTSSNEALNTSSAQ